MIQEKTQQTAQSFNPSRSQSFNFSVSTLGLVAIKVLEFAQESGDPPPFEITKTKEQNDKPIAYLKWHENYDALARHALFAVAHASLASGRHRDGCSTGGRAPKFAKAIMAETERLLRRARHLKSMEVFKLFPISEEPRYVSLEDGEYEVYRDGDSLIQKNPRGSEHSVVQANFCNRYVPTARKNLDKETDQGMKSNTN